MAQHRKRLRRFEIVQQARYLTFSCYHRLPLFGNTAIRDEFGRQIELVHRRGAYRLHGWVIMPEHVHLLLVPQLPEWTMPRILTALKTRFAQGVIHRWRELKAPVLARIEDYSGPRFWQRGGGYDRNIESPLEWSEKINYMHNNPQARGLVANAIDWPWSSARWYAGQRDGIVTIDPQK